MLSRILSVASPFSIYVTLAIFIWAVIKERRRWEWFALIPATAALAASFLLISAEHRLYFDEDIYIHIASNLTHAPVAQVTLLGSPERVEVSAYYKDPPGLPVLLSFIFMFTGTNEKAAFLLARLIYAATVAAVYLLGRSVFAERKRAIVAALIFGAIPVCLTFSSAVSTDLPAAFFTVVGLLGIYSGSGPLAAAALAMAAQTRLEAIAFLPLLFLSRGIDRKWKILGFCLSLVECVHVLWVVSISPALAQAEHVDAAFSFQYVAANGLGIVKYLLNPMLYPTWIPIAAFAAIGIRKEWRWKPLAAWGVIAVSIYPLVKDGNFQRNPRYSLNASVPMALLAGFTVSSPLSYAVATTTLLPYFRTPEEDFARGEHEAAVAFAGQLGPDDLVVTTEPEVFLNRGVPAMNALFASERAERLKAQFNRYNRVMYFSGIRALQERSVEWEADRWLKASFDMRSIGFSQTSGGQVAWYELLKLGDRQAR